VSNYKKRPRYIPGYTVDMTLPVGRVYITINSVEGVPFEIFIRGPKHLQSLYEALGRLVSLSLRSGLPVEDICHHLVGIRDNEPTWWEGVQVLSLPDIIGKLLLASDEIIVEEYFKDV